MFDPLNNLSVSKQVVNPAGAAKASAGMPETSFADVLKKQIGEVAQLQQDASSAVQSLSTGKTSDVDGVMVAMEKSDVAFKTLLAIRSKLMDAYDEIKNIPI